MVVNIVKTNITVQKNNITKKSKRTLKADLSELLFWNLQKKNLTGVIKDLITIKPYDILLFSETTQNIRISLNDMLEPLGYRSRTALLGNVRVAIFDKYKDTNIVFFKEERRFSIIIYDFNGEKYMIVGVHLDSPVSYPNESDRFVLARDEYTIITSYKENHNVNKIVVIGDFNLNPFDRAMISELSFKATHCKQTAKTSSTRKDYLFNPSWRIFSNDLTSPEKKPPGTIHYVPWNKDSYVDYWHVFDQVLISPQLFSRYTDSYNVLTQWNKINLLNSSLIPDRIKFSDHLPIEYTIEIRK